MDENSVQDFFLWENQEWTFLNTDNLGGGGDKNSRKKVSNFNASNPPSLPTPEVDVAHLACEKRVVPSRDNEDGDVQGNDEKNGGNGKEHVNHERSLWIERERRKKIKNMFNVLQDLLPQLPPKVDQSTILDEAIKHIKTLQDTLSHLEKQKLGMTKMATREEILAPIFPTVFKSWTSPNVALNVCGYDAHINICCSMKPGLLASICSVLEKYKIEVLSAHVSSEHNRSMYMIHAQVIGGDACEFPIEEIYKQATKEIDEIIYG